MLRTYPVLAGVLLLSVSGASSSRAQDVTVTPVTWVNPEDTPDRLPTGFRLKPEFPDDLKRSPDIGWAMMEYRLDEKGKIRAVAVFGTQPLYARAMELADRERGKIKPATRGVDPVPSLIRTTAIFNPTSAGAKSRDATPRLVDAAYVIDPARSRSHPAPMDDAEVVWGRVTVGTGGDVTALAEVPVESADLLNAAVRTWKFSPARRAGVPVVADVRVPFIVVGPPAKETRTNQVQPRVIANPPPVYPLQYRMSGWRGEVVVEFTVDKTGAVRDVQVVKSLNPGFNEPAMEAVRRWKFEPGRVDGRPVNTRLQQPISFSLLGMPDGGDDGIEVLKKGKLSTLPKELQYDTGPKSSALVMPVYPYELLVAQTRGSANVALLIGRDGKIQYTRIVSADRPELGFALQAAAELFEYSPALKDGQPTIALLSFKQDFDRYGTGIVPPADEAALRVEQKHPEKIVRADKLDHPLKPTVQRSPIFPRGADVKVDEGSAVIDLVIDPEGNVCLPRVVSSSDPHFGYAAVQAVAAWRFVPPVSAGKPAFVRARVPFQFNRPPAETQGAPAAP